MPDTDTDDPPEVPRVPAIALDGKALKGSARPEQRCRHLLSALTHRFPITLAQTEIGAVFAALPKLFRG